MTLPGFLIGNRSTIDDFYFAISPNINKSRLVQFAAFSEELMSSLVMYADTGSEDFAWLDRKAAKQLWYVLLESDPHDLSALRDLERPVSMTHVLELIRTFGTMPEIDKEADIWVVLLLSLQQLQSWGVAPNLDFCVYLTQGHESVETYPHVMQIMNGCKLSMVFPHNSKYKVSYVRHICRAIRQTPLGGAPLSLV